jgi:hypothetical protein
MVRCINKASKNRSDAFYGGLVKELRKNTNYVALCHEEKELIKKCLLCKSYLSPSQWGPLLEKHIKDVLKITKAKDSMSGDGCSRNKKNVEIKVSLGTSTMGQFNFVHLRPEHKLDYYIMLAYDVHHGKFGKVYWFLCPAKEIYKLIPQYGGYAHGTVAKLGKISSTNLRGKNKEYALRPHLHAQLGSKPRLLWDIMMKKFHVPLTKLRKMI